MMFVIVLIDRICNLDARLEYCGIPPIRIICYEGSRMKVGFALVVVSLSVLLFCKCFLRLLHQLVMFVFTTNQGMSIEYGWVVRQSKDHGPFPNLAQVQVSTATPALVHTFKFRPREEALKERKFQLFSIRATTTPVSTERPSLPTTVVPMESQERKEAAQSQPTIQSKQAVETTRLQRLIDSRPDDPNTYLLRLKDFLQILPDQIPTSTYLEEMSLAAIWKRKRNSIFYSCPKNVRSYMFCQKHWMVTWDSDSKRFAYYKEQPSTPFSPFLYL